MNGMQPLSMNLEIRLPSDEVTTVEFEYLKIEKHCFTCFSLFHEENDCPARPRNPLPLKERQLGITQRIALQRIEADKRRHDDRRGYSRQPASRSREMTETHRNSLPAHRDSRSFNDRNQMSVRHYDDHHRQEPQYRKHPRHLTQLEWEGNSRTLASGKTVSASKESPISALQRDHLGANTFKATESHQSRTPPSRPLRDRIEFPSEQSSERTVSNSRERRPALDRIVETDLRNTPPLGGSHSNGFRRNRAIIDEDRPAKVHLTTVEQEEAPSEDRRIPAPLRLQAPQSPIENVTITLPPTSSKSAGRRRTVRATTKRVVRSPMLNQRLKRNLTTRSSNPPRKKLCTDRVNMKLYHTFTVPE
ncbi:Uncharacterized protein Rs2_31594 [Raphanus sativus]|nr:Uncharacterized protein Rs2_31594 [Raphanus sativus]